MGKKKNLEAIYFPVPQNISLSEKPPLNRQVLELIVRSTLKGAYRLRPPSTTWDYQKKRAIKPQSVATEDQIALVTHLIESLQPTDAIEATLASQYVIAYIRGLEASLESYNKEKIMMDLFDFGHKTLETLQRYRNKGAQQISVQYNVNQGQVVNIQAEKMGI